MGAAHAQRHQSAANVFASGNEPEPSPYVAFLVKLSFWTPAVRLNAFPTFILQWLCGANYGKLPQVIQHISAPPAAVLRDIASCNTRHHAKGQAAVLTISLIVAQWHCHWYRRPNKKSTWRAHWGMCKAVESPLLDSSPRRLLLKGLSQRRKSNWCKWIRVWRLDMLWPNSKCLASKCLLYHVVGAPPWNDLLLDVCKHMLIAKHTVLVKVSYEAAACGVRHA